MIAFTLTLLAIFALPQTAAKVLWEYKMGG